eukprot:scaffold5443_cov291-Pinguiococcus_pyrenoidosus.AAC.6
MCPACSKARGISTSRGRMLLRTSSTPRFSYVSSTSKGSGAMLASTSAFFLASSRPSRLRSTWEARRIKRSSPPASCTGLTPRILSRSPESVLQSGCTDRFGARRATTAFRCRNASRSSAGTSRLIEIALVGLSSRPKRTQENRRMWGAGSPPITLVEVFLCRHARLYLSHAEWAQHGDSLDSGDSVTDF